MESTGMIRCPECGWWHDEGDEDACTILQMPWDEQPEPPDDDEWPMADY